MSGSLTIAASVNLLHENGITKPRILNKVHVFNRPSAPVATLAVGLDNLTVSAIPEPGALALLGIGLLGLAAMRRQTA
jgi:hypothetical protein